MSTSRGIRNNNPGNIDHNPANKWQGLASPPLERGVKNPRFARFISPEYGIRAIAVLLTTYQDRNGCDTIRKIIGRWAPPTENKTVSYVNIVASAVGVRPDDQIDVHDYSIMRPLVEAIIKHENGNQPYPASKINQALHMAGIAPKGAVEKTVSSTSSKTVQGAVVTGTAGVIAATEQVVSIAKETSSGLAPGSIIGIILMVIILAGTAYTIWARLKTKKEIGA
jgi:hypothetical protein